MNELITTIIHRPYVVAFLITFLVIGILNMGVLRTLLWLIIGYFLAFVSEYSSINYGIPYGDYKYIYESMQGELILFGVPVWDSVSYSFLTFASFLTARFFIEPKENIYMAHLSRPAATIVLAAFLTMVLDVIIDPVANLGEKWFLGKIYFYPNGGIHFGVPISNYIGWFFTALIIISTFYFVNKMISSESSQLSSRRYFKGQFLLGPIFYLSIGLFNTIIPFCIGAVWLGIVNAIMLLLLTSFVVVKINVITCNKA